MIIFFPLRALILLIILNKVDVVYNYLYLYIIELYYLLTITRKA